MALPNKKRHQDGFTLTEVLVVIFVITLSMGLLTSLYVAFQRIYNREASRVELYVETTVAMNAIAERVQSSREILASQTINGTVFVSDDDMLALTMQSVTNTDAVNFSSQDYIGYRLDGTKLLEELEAHDVGRTTHTRVLSLDIEKLIITYNEKLPGDADAVSIILIAERVVANHPIQVTLQRTISLRN
ncbi:MAG: prepilin-type N-terminal cleavage/methylation domain-containing protein [Patescibacteria group bacterium]|jgi:prepilin-type N-terminal cleavage/methylation domain-containing protein